VYDHWQPYKVWQVDLWECTGCGHQIYYGSGAQPASIQHMDGFESFRKSVGADLIQINDC
jgi:hypothetical protein